MISFVEHNKNTSHFEDRAQHIIDKFSKAGIIQKTFFGYLLPNSSLLFDKMYMNVRDKLVIEATIWIGDSNESFMIEIPPNLMDQSMEFTDAYIAAMVEIKNVEEAKIAAALKEMTRKQDLAELARLQAKLNAN